MQIELPPATRMIRQVDEVFKVQLKENMLKNPNGSYEPLCLSVKGLENKSKFSTHNIGTYKFEVLGGTHNVLATQELFANDPTKTIFQGRYARLFVGLKDEEALWLASRHNITGCFRHEMTFQDEVICTNIPYIVILC